MGRVREVHAVVLWCNVHRVLKVLLYDAKLLQVLVQVTRVSRLQRGDTANRKAPQQQSKANTSNDNSG